MVKQPSVLKSRTLVIDSNKFITLNLVNNKNAYGDFYMSFVFHDKDFALELNKFMKEEFIENLYENVSADDVVKLVTKACQVDPETFHFKETEFGPQMITYLN